MTAIITADIVNSSDYEPKIWQQILKDLLNQYGKEPKNWEIYRGDSLQLEVSLEKALIAAFHLKSAVKQIKHLDVRIGIGIGNKTYNDKKITSSNGSAFLNSGEIFDQLKKSTLAIKTPNTSIDEVLNLMITLVSLTANNWQPITAFFIKMQ